MKQANYSISIIGLSIVPCSICALKNSLLRNSRYLTADELCRQSGLTKEELEKLREFRLLVPDTKEGKYRPKLVGWGKKLKEKLSNGCTCEEIKSWSKERWNN